MKHPLGRKTHEEYDDLSCRFALPKCTCNGNSTASRAPTISENSCETFLQKIELPRSANSVRHEESDVYLYIIDTSLFSLFWLFPLICPFLFFSFLYLLIFTCLIFSDFWLSFSLPSFSFRCRLYTGSISTKLPYLPETLYCSASVYIYILYTTWVKEWLYICTVNGM